MASIIINPPNSVLCFGHYYLEHIIRREGFSPTVVVSFITVPPHRDIASRFLSEWRNATRGVSCRHVIAVSFATAQPRTPSCCRHLFETTCRRTPTDYGGSSTLSKMNSGSWDAPATDSQAFSCSYIDSGKYSHRQKIDGEETGRQTLDTDRSTDKRHRHQEGRPTVDKRG